MPVGLRQRDCCPDLALRELGLIDRSLACSFENGDAYRSVGDRGMVVDRANDREARGEKPAELPVGAL
jgi:hypothetical protein